MHSLGLLTNPRYSWLFWTQFLGAFNDNFFKNALVMMITFQGLTAWGLEPAQMVALSGAIFILPFILFSSFAGQVSDRMAKATLMRGVKVFEIFAMGVGALGFWLHSLPLLLSVLFLMGVHSTVFGPSKYSILPQLLEERELVTGNALIELGTNLAILGGTILGGLLIGVAGGKGLVAGGTIGIAVIGLVVSQKIPDVPSQNPDLKIGLDPIFPTLEVVAITRKVRSVWLAILGISWFWAFGAAFLSLFPGYAKDVVHGDDHVATLFLAMFSIGIGVGSMICERLSRHGLELGLVPIGSLGMSLFTFDLFLIGQPEVAGTIGVVAFLGHAWAWRILLDLVAVSIFGGFFIVPLYTLMQIRSQPGERSRVIAGNNIVNSIFIVIAALAQTWALSMLTSYQFFAVLAVVNAAVALYIYTVIPEFFWRFSVFVLSNVIYRLDIVGREKFPVDKPYIAVCNHVSFVDWMIVAGAMPTPGRGVMHQSYFDMPGVNLLFRQVKVIPIAGRQDDPELLDAAFDRIAAELEAGEAVFLFPEGRLTGDGEMQAFRAGIERIVQRTPVPVVPMALNGLWGSFFSRKDGQALKKPFRRVWSRITLTVLDPVPPDQVTAAGLEKQVRDVWERGAA